MLGFQNTKTFLIKDTLKTGVFKIKNAVPWTYVISDLNSEPIAGSFHEKKMQKTSQEKFRIEKVPKIKGDKLYFNWKGYNYSFNSWKDKSELV